MARRTYVGRIYLGLEDGKQKFHWVGRFSTKRERDDAVAEARVTKPWLNPGGSAVTTRDCRGWAGRMVDRMETGSLRKRDGSAYKDSTVDTVRTALKPFLAEFGDRDPNTITRVEAEDWVPTVSPGTIAVVVQLMNQLEHAEIIDRNRFAGLSRRPKGRADNTPPSEEEMLMLLDACSALGDHAPMMRSLLTFGAYTLLRPSELIDLDWMHDQGNRFYVPTRYYRGKSALPKSNRPKTIAVVPPARRALDSLREIPGYEPVGKVFRNKSGGRLTAPTLSGYWSRVCARARLDFDLYEATKHYGVWFLKVRMGLPNAVIAAQADWSEKSVTKMVETYGHATDSRRLKELDAAFENFDPMPVLDDETDAPHDAGAPKRPVDTGC